MTRLTRWTVRKQSTHRFGYECATLVNADHDQTFLERSIRNGSRFILGQSGSQSDGIYDLLHDLTDFESFKLEDFQLGHIMKLTKSKNKDFDNVAQLKDWLSELDNVRGILDRRNKNLDFITLQLPPIGSSGDTHSIQQMIADVRMHSEANPKDHYRRLKVGLDLDSAFFVASSPGSTADTVISLLKPLVDNNAIDVLTVATNAMTYTAASKVLRWAKETGSVTTVATEVMRAHHKRPGLLPLNFDHDAKHIPNKGSKRVDATSTGCVQLEDPVLAGLSPLARERVGDIHAATEDFEMAMDRCLSTEKKYLTELNKKHPTCVDPSTVCLAHVLGSTMNTFVFPEEWAYVIKTQIEPRFNDSIMLLAKTHQELSDWTVLYKTMLKYLLASYRSLLQAKAMLLAQNAKEIVEKEIPELQRVAGSADLGQLLALLAASSTGADFTTVGSSSVNSNEWQESWERNGLAELGSSPDFQRRAEKAYSSLNATLEEFSSHAN